MGIGTRVIVKQPYIHDLIPGTITMIEFLPDKLYFVEFDSPANPAIFGGWYYEHELGSMGESVSIC